MAEENGAEGAVDLSAQLETERQARLAAEDRAAIAEAKSDNYKVVALKRKGKLDNDVDFFGDKDEADIEKVIDANVAQTQREREAQRKVEAAERAAKIANDKLAEVIRAQDNKPAGSVGASSGGGQEVKDGIFSEAQEANMKSVWTHRGYSEEAQKRMLETEKKNALARRQL